MEDTPRYAPNPSEELDLSVILSRVISFFRKNLRIFLVTCILSMAVATLICKLLPRTYTARMMVQSTLLNPHEQQEMITNWDQLLNPKGYASLARILDCDPKMLKKVEDMKVEIVGIPSEGNTTFALEVNITDTAILPLLQETLIKGLRNTDYVKRRIAVRKENLLNEIAETRRQMAALDSSGEFVRSLKEKSGGSSYFLDVATIPEARSNLEDRLAAYQEKLAFVDDMQVLQGFIRSKHVKPRLSVFLPAGLAIGFIIGYIFSMLNLAWTRAKKS